jgi:hypothetical protein
MVKFDLQIYLNVSLEESKFFVFLNSQWLSKIK